MVAVLISWLSIGNTFSFGGKPGEKGIDLNRTEFLRLLQLMKAYEIADPLQVGLFSTDAVRITVLTCSRKRGLLEPSMAAPILFLYTAVMIEQKEEIKRIRSSIKGTLVIF